MSIRFVPVILTLCALLTITFTPTLAAPAAVSFTVNKAKDGKDAAPGDGVCETKPGNHKCTLRAAVQEVNALYAANGGSYTIVLADKTYPLTRVGADNNAAKGDLDIRANLTIQGQGAAQTHIEGNGAATGDRVFHVHDGKVKFVGVSIAGGKIPGDFGGGIFNEASASLKLRKSTVRQNQADSGGGIASGGTLKVVKSVIENNSSVHTGGGLFLYGPSTLNKSTIRGNDANSAGGGLASSGSLTVMQSTLSGNHTVGVGGGIYNWAGGELYLINSTVSGNSAAKTGGGIHNRWLTGPPTQLTLYSATITNNSAGVGFTGGGIFNDQGFVSARNSLIALNRRAVNGIPYFFVDDCKGDFYSQNFNLIYDVAGCSITGTSTNNQYSTYPELETLQNNGGLTETHALKANSPAIDTANGSGCVNHLSAPLTTDRRNSARVADGNGDTTSICDIGAYEFQP